MDLLALCLKVNSLCRELGEYMKKEISQVEAEQVETKALNSLVSYVDKTAEKRIVETLGKLLPEAGFLAEEGSGDGLAADYNWIIDPLDGTTNFLHGLPVYSISIALQHRDEIILGVVYEVNREECFYSWKGAPAYLNGKEISVSATKQLADSLLATGFPYYDFKRLDPYFELLKHLAQNSRGIRRMGSAAVDLAYVACGRFDAFFEYSLNPWDVASGAFIVRQAGGQVSDFSGEGNWLHGKEIVASSSGLAGEMEELVRAYLKKQ